MTNHDPVESLTVAEVRELLSASDPDEALLRACEEDSRRGVQDLGRVARRRLEREHRERARLAEMYRFEERLHSQGVVHVAGVDEVGRGPLAGPVLAACVIMPPAGPFIPGVDDSKKLSPKKRVALSARIREVALGVGLGRAESEEIDEVDIHRATRRAMSRAIENCGPARPDALLIDAVTLPSEKIRQISIVHGDSRCYSIAAASILAKVARDAWMIEQDSVYPGYGFASNKGYGTAEHLAALEKRGLCPLHRRSFAPVSAYELPSMQAFLRAIHRARSTSRLRSVGLAIRTQSASLTPSELDELRQEYRKRQNLIRSGDRSL